MELLRRAACSISPGLRTPSGSGMARTVSRSRWWRPLNACAPTPACSSWCSLRSRSLLLPSSRSRKMPESLLLLLLELWLLRLCTCCGWWFACWCSCCCRNGFAQPMSPEPRALFVDEAHSDSTACRGNETGPNKKQTRRSLIHQFTGEESGGTFSLGVSREGCVCARFLRSYLENRLGRGRKLETSSITGGGGGALEAERVGPGRVRVVAHQPGIHHEDVARREACVFFPPNRRGKRGKNNKTFELDKKAGRAKKRSEARRQRERSRKLFSLPFRSRRSRRTKIVKRESARSRRRNGNAL